MEQRVLISTYLLQRGDVLTVICCIRIDHTGGKVNHTGGDLGASRCEFNDLGACEGQVGWRLWYRGESEEVLNRVLEAGEVTYRADPAGRVLIEKSWGHRSGTVLDDCQVQRVDGTVVDGGDGVQIALLVVDLLAAGGDEGRGQDREKGEDARHGGWSDGEVESGWNPDGAKLWIASGEGRGKILA